MRFAVSLRTGFIILVVFTIGLLASTITLAVLYDKEHAGNKGLALSQIQKSLREMGVHDALSPDNDDVQKESFINNVLRTLAHATGWKNKHVDKKAVISLKNNPSIGSQFFSLYPYEEPNVHHFNPTYIECHDIYIMRTHYAKTTMPGYDYVDQGPFQVDKKLIPLNTAFQGNPYVMPHRHNTGVQNPVLEDIRYVGQHTKTGRVFLNGTVIIRRFSAIRMALIEYHHTTKTLDVLHIFPSPEGGVEKNWLLRITDQSQEEDEPVFDILYSFHQAVTCYRFHLHNNFFEMIQAHPIQWPEPYDNTSTLIRGSALLSDLPNGQHMLLVHRRSVDYYYYYYAALLDRDFKPIKTLQYPVLMERPFRITFVMNIYRKGDYLAFTAGIEDRMSCVIRYSFNDFMDMFTRVDSSEVSVSIRS